VPRRQPGAATVLAGAQGRLLPASVPFRFFGASIAFHLLAWLALAVAAPGWADWRGGPGWPLAALHLFTLGALVSAAIGASLQLLPVATRQPVRSARAAGALWWLHVPGAAVLALGMGLARPGWIATGAAAVIAVVVAWAMLLAANLRGARGMPGVVLHGWGAIVAIAVLAASAAGLAAFWLGAPVLDRDTLRALHAPAGILGTLGLLALGLSYVLLPMFALAPNPDARAQVSSGAAAIAAVALAGVAGAGLAPMPVRAAAVAAGAVAAFVHWRLARSALAGGLRADLGPARTLIRLSWAMLGLAPVLAAAIVAGAGSGTQGGAALAERLGPTFVVVAVVGWLGSLLAGVLQRILPFLASMHAARGRRRAPVPSALAVGAPLRVHLACHAVALAALVAATLARSSWLAALAALAGALGAAALAAFFVVLVRRTRAAAAAPDLDRAAPRAPGP
jgi:hypothetical protein